MWWCHYISNENTVFNERIETNVPWHHVYLEVEPITCHTTENKKPH